MANPLKSVRQYGQSIWFDNIRRDMMSSGSLKRLITEDDVRGVTSNPTIFDKAISGSNDYDEDIRRGTEQGQSAEEIYWSLVVKDIQDAADIFLPVYNESRGPDGYISVEVSPLLAHDTPGTIAQARQLHKRVGRKNVMIKVPATPEGLSAVRTLIGEGIPVNCTLIFSILRYREVMEAYIAGQEDAAGKGIAEPPASVASFFVSRLDTDVDKILQEKIKAASGEEAGRLKALIGKTAIANSKLAYQEFKRVFSGERFKKLQAKGIPFQRPLWASTSTKNPEYSDVIYMEPLIGPHTVNTVPPATLDAYRDHGSPAARIEERVDECEAQLKELAAQGIDLDAVTDNLEEKGVRSFADSFNQLIKHLEEKKEKLAVRE